MSDSTKDPFDAKTEHRTAAFPSLIEVLVLFAIALISPTFAVFSGFWTAMSFAALFTFFAALALVRKRWYWASSLMFVSLVIAIPSVPTLPKLFPLQQAVTAADFQNSTVSEVLQHLSRSNTGYVESPVRSTTQAIADQRVSLNIPHGTGLGEALTLLMNESTGNINGTGTSPVGTNLARCVLPSIYPATNLLASLQIAGTMNCSSIEK